MAFKINLLKVKEYGTIAEVRQDVIHVFLCRILLEM